MRFLQKSKYFKSLRIQLRVLKALYFREIITRYGRYNIGFLWLFVEPMIFTLGVAALWSLVKPIVGDIPVFSFAITGYSTVLLWRNAASRCSLAIEPNQALMYHRNVTITDIFLSRVLLEVVGTTISFIVLVSFFSYLGLINMPDNILKVLFAWLLLSWFAVALGFVVGSMSELSPFFDRLWQTSTYLLFPISGALFMVSWLPSYVAEVVLWIPMVHATELLRDGFFGDIVTAIYDLSYFIIFTLILNIIGFLMIKELEKRVEPQ